MALAPMPAEANRKHRIPSQWHGLPLRSKGKRVLLYFSKEDLPQSHDPLQWQKEYQQQLQSDTLCWEFEDPTGLHLLASKHLASVVHELTPGSQASRHLSSASTPSGVALVRMVLGFARRGKGAADLGDGTFLLDNCREPVIFTGVHVERGEYVGTFDNFELKPNKPQIAV